MQVDVSDSSMDDIGASPHPQSQLSLRPLGSGSGLRSEYIDHYMRGFNLQYLYSVFFVFDFVFGTVSFFLCINLTCMRCSSLRYLGSVFSTLSSESLLPSISFLSNLNVDLRWDHTCTNLEVDLLQDVPVLHLNISVHICILAFKTLLQFVEHLNV